MGYVRYCVAVIAAVAISSPSIAATLNGQVYSDPSVPISVASGSQFLIALPSNPTTGYSWTVHVSDPKNIEFEGSAYQPYPASEKMLGSGGQQIFVFEAHTAGTASIMFGYARSWEKGTLPAKTAIFNVSISK